MPEFKDLKRKAAYKKDIGKMISQNTILTQGGKNTEFVNSFREVSRYFSRQKDKFAEKLAGYVQNFINVVESQSSATDERSSERFNSMVTNIDAMREFRAFFDQYLDQNGGYSALKNDNVKMLSAMVQVADNMIHRTDMETRAENVTFIQEQLKHENNVRKNSEESYKDYVFDCSAINTNFLDIETEYEKQVEKATEDKKLYERLQKEYKDITVGKSIENDEKLAAEYLKKIEDFNSQYTEMRAKTEKLKRLSESFHSFVEASTESEKTIKTYNEKIENNKKRIQEANKQIEEEQKKADAANNVREKYNTMKSELLMDLNLTEDGTKYLRENIESFKSLAETYPDIKSLLNKKEKDFIDNINITLYETTKGYLISLNPEIESEFDEMEEAGTFSEFVKDDGGSIENALTVANEAMAEVSQNEELQDYYKLQNIIASGEASERVIKALNSKISEMNNDINMHQELISYAKIGKEMAKDIVNTAGSLPKPPFTETDLHNFLDRKYADSNNELIKMQESGEIKELVKKREEVLQRIENKKSANIQIKLNQAKVASENSIARVKVVGELVKKHRELKGKSDRLVDARKSVLEKKNSINNLNHNKEIYNRLQSIQTRFKLKTNNKMNTDCKNMMDQLEETMKLFNPEKDENLYNFTDQQNALNRLQTLSAKYIEAKKAQRIPKFFASEQRLLRISCAEELQCFSETAKSMVEDVKTQDIGSNYELANLYKNREPNDAFKCKLDEMSMEKATRNIPGLQEQYGKFLRERNERMRKISKTETKEGVSVTSSTKQF